MGGVLEPDLPKASLAAFRKASRFNCAGTLRHPLPPTLFEGLARQSGQVAALGPAGDGTQWHLRYHALTYEQELGQQTQPPRQPQNAEVAHREVEGPSEKAVFSTRHRGLAVDAF